MRRRRATGVTIDDERRAEAYAAKARASMKEVDALPPQVRAIVHEHGVKHPAAVQAMRFARAQRVGDALDRLMS